MSTREKWGIFGGTFNPVHNGHVKGLLQVRQQFKLDKILIIPNYQNPLKVHVEGPSAKDRLEMVKLAFSDHRDVIEVLDIEILRGGPSFTFETLQYMVNEHPDVDLYFIVGADVFAQLDQWQNPHEVLASANFVVMNRPGSTLPTDLFEMPEVVQELAEDELIAGELKLNTGRSVFLAEIDELDISANDIRRGLRQEMSDEIVRFLPTNVLNYIKEHRLYEPLRTKITDFERFTQEVANLLNDKKAIDLRMFDLRNLEMPSEFTIVASGTSTRHASSMGEEIVKKVKEQYGLFPLSVEGLSEGRWVLVDYGALIIHVFYDYLRQEYRLEDLWKNGKILPIVTPPTTL